MTLDLYLMTQPFIFLLEILKNVVAGAVVFFLAWHFIRPYLNKVKHTKPVNLNKPDPGLLALRLQAYERLVLFVERINPQNMLLRIHVSGGNVIQLQQQVLTEIRAEYQHNITQQIYVSAESWQLIKKIKEDTVFLLNSAARKFSPEASSVELSRAILTHLSSLELNPYDIALDLIKKEVRQNFEFN